VRPTGIVWYLISLSLQPFTWMIDFCNFIDDDDDDDDDDDKKQRILVRAVRLGKTKKGRSTIRGSPGRRMVHGVLVLLLVFQCLYPLSCKALSASANTNINGAKSNSSPDATIASTNSRQLQIAFVTGNAMKVSEQARNTNIHIRDVCQWRATCG
jgi:hypothetical protein